MFHAGLEILEMNPYSGETCPLKSITDMKYDKDLEKSLIVLVLCHSFSTELKKKKNILISGLFVAVHLSKVEI